MAFDLYQHVTDTLFGSLEAGTPAWRKPWTDDTAAFPPRASGEHRRGIIILSDQLVRASELSRRAPVRPVIEGSCWRWHLARQHAPSPKRDQHSDTLFKSTRKGRLHRDCFFGSGAQAG